MALTNEQKLDAYRLMMLIRRFEERCAQLYQEGDIGGFLHLYIGQEAVAAGLRYAINDDNVITAYRDHGIALAMGLPAKNVMAEMLGKTTGVSKGKGGSMHLADVDKRFWGGYAVVGGHLPLATGLALADQYRGDDRVTICLMGDGSTNIGYFHEALNMSGVWDLPVVWVIENNEYGMGTSVERASAVRNLTKRAEAYGMKSNTASGMDVEEVRQTLVESIKYVKENGPVLIELQTYRFRGHSMGDAERYREKTEVEKYQSERDPLDVWARHLMDNDLATREDLEEIEDEAEAEVEEAVEFARQSPDPAPEDLYENVYVE